MCRGLPAALVTEAVLILVEIVDLAQGPELMVTIRELVAQEREAYLVKVLNIARAQAYDSDY